MARKDSGKKQRKKAVGLWLRQIIDILNRDWNPIGGCPEGWLA
jgi:hypothetical protein